jgi:hypothetical protein
LKSNVARGEAGGEKRFSAATNGVDNASKSPRLAKILGFMPQG